MFKDEDEAEIQRTKEMYLKYMIANSYYPDDHQVQESKFDIKRAIREDVEK